ncbi:MAG: hypothetical protein ABI120_25200, partial [Gemmatimonadaceae bacterium]
GTNVGAGRIPGIATKAWIEASGLQGLALEAQVQRLGQALLLGQMTPDTRAVLLSGSNPLAARAGMEKNRVGRPPTLNDLVGLAIASPEFQRR